LHATQYAEAMIIHAASVKREATFLDIEHSMDASRRISYRLLQPHHK